MTTEAAPAASAAPATGAPAAPPPAAPAAAPAAQAPAASQAPAANPELDQLRSSYAKAQEEIEAGKKKWDTLANFLRGDQGATDLPPEHAAKFNALSVTADNANRRVHATELAHRFDAHSPLEVAKLLKDNKAFTLTADGELKDPAAAETAVQAYKKFNPWAFRQAAPPAAAPAAAPAGVVPDAAAAGLTGTPPPGTPPADAAPRKDITQDEAKRSGLGSLRKKLGGR